MLMALYVAVVLLVVTPFALPTPGVNVDIDADAR